MPVRQGDVAPHKHGRTTRAASTPAAPIAVFYSLENVQRHWRTAGKAACDSGGDACHCAVGGDPGSLNQAAGPRRCFRCQVGRPVFYAGYRTDRKKGISSTRPLIVSQSSMLRQSRTAGTDESMRARMTFSPRLQHVEQRLLSHRQTAGSSGPRSASQPAFSVPTSLCFCQRAPRRITPVRNGCSTGGSSGSGGSGVSFTASEAPSRTDSCMVSGTASGPSGCQDHIKHKQRLQP